MERLSRTTIERERLHEWRHFESKLARDPWVEGLLDTTLRSWVANTELDNPLAIRWVYLVWNEQLHYLHRTLESWIGTPMDLNILELMLAELGSYRCSADAEQKIESLTCEAAVYRLLRVNWPEIERLGSAGDWGAGQRRISVKSELPLELTYKIVDHALRAWQAIANNRHARLIKYVRLVHLDTVDCRSLPVILRFIDTDLDCVVGHWLRDGATNGELPGEYRYVRTGGGKLQLALLDPSDHSRKIAELEFETGKDDQSLVDIAYDKNSWWYEPLDEAWLQSRLRGHLEKVSAENEQADRTIEAWVNLFVHPRNEAWILDSLSEIQRLLRHVARDFEFPVSVCLHPEWVYKMGAPCVWSFNGGIGDEL